MFFPPQRVIKVSLTSERNTIITLHSSVTLFYFIQSHLKFVFLKEKEQVSLKGQGWRGLGDRVRVCLGLQVCGWVSPELCMSRMLAWGRGQVMCQCLGHPVGTVPHQCSPGTAPVLCQLCGMPHPCPPCSKVGTGSGLWPGQGARAAHGQQPPVYSPAPSHKPLRKGNSYIDTCLKWIHEEISCF